VPIFQTGRRLDRQSSLAHSTGSNECHQPTGGNRITHLFQFSVTPQECGERFEEVARHGLQRWREGRRLPLSDESGILVEDARLQFAQTRARVDS
jgi:hypothetical protein